MRGDARPERVGTPAARELADRVQRHRWRGRRQRQAEPVDLGHDVVGQARIDFAKEARRDVELLVILPARTTDPVHQVEQHLADGEGRAEREKQAEHRRD